LKNKRRRRYKKKKVDLILILKIATIFYLTIFGVNYVSSDTAAYHNSQSEVTQIITAGVWEEANNKCSEDNTEVGNVLSLMEDEELVELNENDKMDCDENIDQVENECEPKENILIEENVSGEESKIDCDVEKTDDDDYTAEEDVPLEEEIEIDTDTIQEDILNCEEILNAYKAEYKEKDISPEEEIEMNAAASDDVKTCMKKEELDKTSEANKTIEQNPKQEIEVMEGPVIVKTDSEGNIETIYTEVATEKEIADIENPVEVFIEDEQETEIE